MNVILLFNGLGNQMSQYAFYLAKSQKELTVIPMYYYNEGLSHNGYELDRIFSIRTNNSFLHHWLKSFFIKYLQKGKVFNFSQKFVRIIEEPKDYEFNEDLFSKRSLGINFYWGGWHSEKYFKNIEPKIREVFTFNPNILSTNCREWSQSIAELDNSCSLHIRRGDYLSHPYFNNIATIEYYNKAIETITTLKGAQEFFVFSNDIEWCKSQFGEGNFHYIDCNSGEDSWQDMYLMSICKNHINANSTFSWWGAWLCRYKDSVTIVPKQFTTLCETPDIYPDSWIKID